MEQVEPLLGSASSASSSAQINRAGVRIHVRAPWELPSAVLERVAPSKPLDLWDLQNCRTRNIITQLLPIQKKIAGSHLPHIFTSFTSSSYDPPMLSPRNQLLGWSIILVDHRWLNQVHIPILIRLHPAKLSQQFHPIPINNHHGWKPYRTHKLLGDIPITSQLYTTLSHDK